MSEPEIEERAREAVKAALGHETTDDVIGRALAEYGDLTTGDLEAELEGKRTAFDAAGGRGVELAETIDALRIVLAVRSLSPDAGPEAELSVDCEIEVERRQWPGRVEVPTLVVSLDGLANILMGESAVIDPDDVARLMAAVCRRAVRVGLGDAALARREAAFYEAEAGEEVPEPPTGSRDFGF